MEFSKHNWAMISETILLFASKCSFLASRPLILDIVISEYPGKSHKCQEFHFYDVITLVLYSCGFGSNRLQMILKFH